MRKNVKVKLTYVNKFSNVVEKIIEDEKVFNALTALLEDVGVHYTVEDLQVKGYVRI